MPPKLVLLNGPPGVGKPTPARTHLSAGHDVIVPQLLTRREFVEELHALAGEVGASFHELVLLGDRAAVIERARRRSEPAGGFSARALAAKQGSSIEEAYDRFVEALEARDDAVVIPAESLDDAYAALSRLLDRPAVDRGAGSGTR